MPEGDSTSMMPSTIALSTNVGVVAMADLAYDDDGIAPVIVCCRKNLAGVNEVHDAGVTCINFTSRWAIDIGTNGIARGVREGGDGNGFVRVYCLVMSAYE